MLISTGKVHVILELGNGLIRLIGSTEGGGGLKLGNPPIAVVAVQAASTS